MFRVLRLILLLIVLLPPQLCATTTLYVDTDATSPTHPTYSSLSAAITYLQGYNGGVLDDDFVIECAGTTTDDGQSVNIDGDNIVMTVDNDLTIRGDGNYLLSNNSSTFAPLSVNDEVYLTLQSIRIKSLGYGNYYQEAISGNINSGAVFRISNVWIDGPDDLTKPSNTPRGIMAGGLSSGTYYIDNVVITGFTSNKGDGRGIDTSYAVSYIRNATVVGCAQGVNLRGQTYVNNAMSVDNGEDFFASSTADGTYSHNISSDDTAPGLNSLINQTSTDLMVDPNNGDYTLKQGSPAIAAGTYIATVTTDITGATRPNPPSIGAFDVVQSVVTPWHYYNGNAWIDAVPNRYNGSGWEGISTKRYTGSVWE